jgi:hypothetical protein
MPLAASLFTASYAQCENGTSEKGFAEATTEVRTSAATRRIEIRFIKISPI